MSMMSMVKVMLNLNLTQMRFVVDPQALSEFLEGQGSRGQLGFGRSL